MQQEQKSFRTFEDLEVYQVAREFRKMMYRVAKRLPDVDKFGLASQIRRATEDELDAVLGASTDDQFNDSTI